jgi:hypothetical protein
LTSAVRGSAESARRVCATAVPMLSGLVVDSTSESVKEKMTGLLCDLIGAAVEIGKDLPRKSHPLFPHVQGLQTVALELCQHAVRVLRERGLALLCDLCFRTPLAAVEAQSLAFARVLEQGADATLSAVSGMSVAMQTELALPRLISCVPQDAALGGLCALYPAVVVPSGEALFSSLLGMSSSPLAAAALGNFANKGQASPAVVAQWLSAATLSSVQLAWIGRGLVMSGDPLTRKLLDVVLDRCKGVHDTELLLETIFGNGLEALSASSSHAIERPLGRQKAFCQLFPALVEQSNLHAVGILAGVVAPAVLLGELGPLLPLLLAKVKEGVNENASLQGALMVLAAVVKGKSIFWCFGIVLF